MLFGLALVIILAVAIIILVLVLGVLSAFGHTLMDLNDGEELDEVLFYALIAVAGAVVLSFFDLQVANDPLPIRLNITGVIIPMGVFALLLITRRVEPLSAAVSICAVALVAFPLTRVVNDGAMISFPLWLVPAAVAAVCGFLMTTKLSRRSGYSGAATAYGAACMGMLIGGDLLHLPDLISQGGNSLIIGAGGLTDFVFLTGVVSVALVWTIAAMINVKQLMETKNRMSEY